MEIKTIKLDRSKTFDPPPPRSSGRGLSVCISYVLKLKIGYNTGVKKNSRFFPPPAYLRFPTCGLDISDRSVKFAEIVKYRKHLRLGRYGEEELPAGVVVNGGIQDPSVLLATLKRIKERAGYDFAHVALPEEKSYVVEMVLPASAGRDLRGAIELHLEEQVPLEIRATTFDYEIVHSPEEIAGGRYIVVVSATETSLASIYFDVCREAGLLPGTFELESQAIARALVKEGEETKMIVDVGREQSNVSVVCRNQVRLSTSIGMGGNTLSEAIETDLGVDAVTAVRLKDEDGLRRGQDRSPFYSIVRVATILRDEIYQRMSYWNSGRERSNIKDAVKRIILCGGNASIPGFTEYLTSGSNIPVSIGNPWSNMLSFDEEIPEITSRESLKYCTAIGLALRSVHYD